MPYYRSAGQLYSWMVAGKTGSRNSNVFSAKMMDKHVSIRASCGLSKGAMPLE